MQIKVLTELTKVSKILQVVFWGIVISLIFAVSVQAAEGIITGDVVNVRKGPGTNFARVGQVYVGDKVQLLEEKSNWMRVKTASGQTGWIAGWLIGPSETGKKSTSTSLPEKIESPVTGSFDSSVLSTVKVTATNVNLRSGPGTEFVRVGKVTVGNVLPCLGEKSGWYNVRDSDQSVWIAGWLVEYLPVSPPSKPEVSEPRSEQDAESRVDPEPMDNGSDTTSEPEEGTHPPVPVKEEEPSNSSSSEVKPEADSVSLRLVRDNQGIRLFMDTLGDPEVEIKKYNPPERQQVVYRFKERKLSGDPRFSVKLGGGRDKSLSVSALELGDDLQVLIEFPSGLLFETESGKENPGMEGQNKASKQQVFYLPNQITDITEIVNKNGMQTLLVRALSPVKYKYEELKEEVRLDLIGVQPGSELINANLQGKIVKNLKLKEATEPSRSMYLQLPTRGMKRASATELCDGTVISLVLMPAQESRAEAKVVIDAGHGGKDPGAIASRSGCQEKDHNLSIALGVKDQLEKAEIDVICTRITDKYLSLNERSDLANQAGADVFVSIHCNAYTNPETSGTMTFFYAPPDKMELQAQRGERQRLAEMVQRQLVQELGRIDKGVREENFAVLRNTTMPSILIEVAFLSNPEEDALLQQPEFRARAAQAIARGVIEYLGI